MSVAQVHPAVTTATGSAPSAVKEVVVYDHSNLLYWWPVWAVGYALAIVTAIQGRHIEFEDAEVIIHPSKNLGVIYAVVFILVMLMTNVAVRGNASLTVIATILAATFCFAYMGWWDNIFRAIQQLAMFMNLGFYVFFSTAVFIIWVLSVFIFDRLSWWSFRPGQAIHHVMFGGGAQTYDTHGMSVYKMRDDLFRHWVLGLGSGDLKIAAAGATRGEFVLHNVLFIGRKLTTIQELVSMSPDEALGNTVTAGDPS